MTLKAQKLWLNGGKPANLYHFIKQFCCILIQTSSRAVKCFSMASAVTNIQNSMSDNWHGMCFVPQFMEILKSTMFEKPPWVHAIGCFVIAHMTTKTPSL